MSAVVSSRASNTSICTIPRFVALDVDLDCDGLAGERNKIIEAHDLDLVALSFRGGVDDLGKADVALRSGHQPKSPRLGAERHRMDFQIGVEQAVDQEIGAKVNAIAAVGSNRMARGTKRFFMRM